jgi:hypothetical protein
VYGSDEDSADVEIRPEAGHRKRRHPVRALGTVALGQRFVGDWQQGAAMSDPEKTMTYLEEQIPALSCSAVTVAYWQTLASGESVLETDSGAIYEVFPDGSRRLVKQIAAPTPVETGRKIRFR